MSENPTNDDQDVQASMNQYGGGVPLGVPPEMAVDSPSDAYGTPPPDIANELERYGITPEVVGHGPEDVDARWLTNIYRYQFFSEYLYEAGGGPDDYTEVAPIQFRTSIYTIGHPSQALMDYLADHAHGRQKTLFDTGVYDNYFTNWAPFEDYNQNVEGPERVGPNEVKAALGIPFFEVEIYDEDRKLRGEARGYLDPFTLVEHETPPPPKQERWKIGHNEARGVYEFQPEGNAKQRLIGLEKIVSLDGHYIGTVYPSRGTVELPVRYKNDSQTHTHRKTGLLRHSRQFFLDNDIFHPNAIAKGGAVWKTDETEDTITLVSTKPSGDFQPMSPADVDERATGTAVSELALDPDQPTPFEVRADNKVHNQGGALGYYTPIAERDIATETAFLVHDEASGTTIEK